MCRDRCGYPVGSSFGLVAARFFAPCQRAPEQEFSLPATTTCTKKREHRMRVDQIRVDEAQVVEEADNLRLIFPVTHGQTQTPVWFRVRNADAAPSGNVALAIALVPAMRAARSLVLADSLSARLFASQAAIQKLFQRLGQPVQRRANHCSSCRPHQASTGGTGLFFTGGVDSFFSLLRHREEITHLILCADSISSVISRRLIVRCCRPFERSRPK